MNQESEKNHEKGKAKRPLAARDCDGREYAICPSCSRTVSDGEYFFRFCPDCGQEMDWKREESKTKESKKYPLIDAKVKFSPIEEWDIPEEAINFTGINCRPEDRFLISCNSCGQTSVVDSSHGCYCPVCGPDTIAMIVSRKVTKVLKKESKKGKITK